MENWALDKMKLKEDKHKLLHLGEKNYMNTYRIMVLAGAY